MMVETGKPIAAVARDLGIHDGTLGNWVNAWRREHPEPDQPLSPVERAREGTRRGEPAAADGERVPEEIVARLEADWPDWQIWTVPKAIGGTIWCARRWDGSGQVLNAASADELAEYLEEASSR
jgi:hypothetical protein